MTWKVTQIFRMLQEAREGRPQETPRQQSRALMIRPSMQVAVVQTSANNQASANLVTGMFLLMMAHLRIHADSQHD